MVKLYYLSLSKYLFLSNKVTFTREIATGGSTNGPIITAKALGG